MRPRKQLAFWGAIYVPFKKKRREGIFEIQSIRDKQKLDTIKFYPIS